MSTKIITSAKKSTERPPSAKTKKVIKVVRNVSKDESTTKIISTKNDAKSAHNTPRNGPTHRIHAVSKPKEESKSTANVPSNIKEKEEEHSSDDEKDENEEEESHSQKDIAPIVTESQVEEKDLGDDILQGSGDADANVHIVICGPQPKHIFRFNWGSIKKKKPKKEKKRDDSGSVDSCI
jgi:hypothetical protein